ncbi:hypothetical protein BHE90_009585 [Fusarium euwallaceae]|nr:hypothetical protein CDV36_007427 [Fusarium kuroshium]RSL84957.1 hypothetical protein CEP51_003593 [Fusarium floridanum]RSM12209.1 hypothetical protein CDV31_006415 [Fusarium ambrosium]RTE75962.1 hypothetical protein BHE90_009585 [Fusarium euwallaceae]
MCQIWAHPEMTTVPEMNAKTPRSSIVNGGVRAARNRCAVLGTKDLGDLNSTAQPPHGKSTPGAASGARLALRTRPFPASRRHLRAILETRRPYP